MCTAGVWEQVGGIFNRGGLCTGSTTNQHSRHTSNCAWCTCEGGDGGSLGYSGSALGGHSTTSPPCGLVSLGEGGWLFCLLPFPWWPPPSPALSFVSHVGGNSRLCLANHSQGSQCLWKGMLTVKLLAVNYRVGAACVCSTLPSVGDKQYGSAQAGMLRVHQSLPKSLPSL